MQLLHWRRQSCVLQWAAMAVRGDQYSEEGLPHKRLLPAAFRELDEGGMSELSAACAAAGLRELYLTGMKLQA